MKERSSTLFALFLCSTAFFGCKDMGTTPVPNQSNVLRDFFWSSPPGSISFADSNSTEQHTITRLQTDTSKFVDRTASTTGNLRISISSDSVVIDSLSETTFFSLPPNMYLQGSSRKISGKYLPVHRSFVATSKRVIVQSDSGAIYYSDDSGGQWSLASGTIANPAIDFAQDSSGTLYLLTPNQLYYSLDNGVSWSVFQTGLSSTIFTSLACGRNKIFLADTTTIFESTGPGTTFAPMLANKFLAITSISYSISQDALAVCASSSSQAGEVFILQPSNSIGWRSIVVDSTNPPSFVAFDRSDNLYGMSKNLTFYINLPPNYSISWSGPSIAGRDNFVSLAPLGSDSIIISTSNNALYILHAQVPSNTLSIAQARIIPAQIRNVSLGIDGNGYLAADAGLYRYSASNVNNLVGPREVTDSFDVGQLLLLFSHAGAITVGDTWAAGILAQTGTTATFELTARVTGQVDSLITPRGAGHVSYSFGQTLIVRYANETGGNIGTTLPYYWNIYYSKGFGPTMIDRFHYDNTSSKWTLEKRLELLKP